MYSDNKTVHRAVSTTFRWRPTIRGSRRRQRMASIRLGNKKPRKGYLFLVRLCRKAKLKWLRVKYMSMLKKLKKYYDSIVNDVLHEGGAGSSFQERRIMETSFAAPVMGLGFDFYPCSSYSYTQKVRA